MKEQETAAAGMDPDTELQTLHKRFSNWKHEFKVSLSKLHYSYCTDRLFSSYRFETTNTAGLRLQLI